MKTAFCFVTIFPIEKNSFSGFILCLDVFVLSLNTGVPFNLFFNRHILRKWMGLSLPGCFFPLHLLFPNQSVLLWLDRFIKNHSFRPFE